MQSRAMREGFTIVELMIVISIVAILFVTVIPGYSRYIHTGNRALAIIALVDLQSNMQQYRTNNNTYPTSVDELYGGSSNLYVTQLGDISDNNTNAIYELSIESADAISYIVRVTPLDVMKEDRCGILQITSDNIRSVEQTTSITTANLYTADYCWRL